MQCQECKDDFPDGLVQDMVVNSTREKCCGVCALKNVRESIGHPTYMFKAPNAKRIYDECKKIKDDKAAKN